MVGSWYFMRIYLYETSRNIQEPWPSWPIFYSPLTSDLGQIIKVKIFGQGRISRPINGRKLIFHVRIYLYETSWIIQEPWPPDLYFTIHWHQTLARLSRLRFLAKVESQDSPPPLLLTSCLYCVILTAVFGCLCSFPVWCLNQDVETGSLSLPFIYYGRWTRHHRKNNNERWPEKSVDLPNIVIVSSACFLNDQLRIIQDKGTENQ